MSSVRRGIYWLFYDDSGVRTQTLTIRCGNDCHGNRWPSDFLFFGIGSFIFGYVWELYLKTLNPMLFWKFYFGANILKNHKSVIFPILSSKMIMKMISKETSKKENSSQTFSYKGDFGDQGRYPITRIQMVLISKCRISAADRHLKRHIESNA